MERSEVLKHLKNFIDRKKQEQQDKKTARLLSALEFVTEQGITFGNCPKYFFARMECNSTGVGTSSFKGTETQRTVALDYVTDEYLFIDGHVGAGAKGLSLFFLKKGEIVNYYKKSDIEKVAKHYGFQRHLQDFRDLNFILTDHRLNRHQVHITKDPFSFPIRPIIATISKKGEKMTVGYVYEKEGKEYILIEPEEIKGESENSGCAPWMFLSILFPPLIIIAIIVWLSKSKLKSMTE